VSAPTLTTTGQWTAHTARARCPACRSSRLPGPSSPPTSVVSAGPPRGLVRRHEGGRGAPGDPSRRSARPRARCGSLRAVRFGGLPTPPVPATPDAEEERRTGSPRSSGPCRSDDVHVAPRGRRLHAVDTSGGPLLGIPPWDGGRWANNQRRGSSDRLLTATRSAPARQDSTPRADVARMSHAAHRHNSAPRGRLSHDHRGPHKGSALEVLSYPEHVHCYRRCWKFYEQPGIRGDQ
jgi:hypothetical protein